MPLSPDVIARHWDEFRATFASAYLLHWLVSELGDQHPEYYDNLRMRLGDRDSYLELFQKEGTYDGEVPVHSIDGDIAFWASYEEVQKLEERLYPVGLPAGHPSQTGLAASVVALHSSLDWFTKTIGVGSRPDLPEAIRRFVRPASIDSKVFDRLRICDAVRHLIVHNRQVVDQKYVDQVPGNRFLPGEFRLLTPSEIHEFADAVFRAATALRDAATAPA